MIGYRFNANGSRLSGYSKRNSRQRLQHGASQPKCHFKIKALAKIVSSVVGLILAFCGCSKPAHLPAEFAQRLSKVDHVVVATNRNHLVAFSISGDTATKLAKAVASARQDSMTTDAIFDLDLEFYAGTNIVTLIHVQDRVFLLGDTQYIDDSGVLATFWRKVWSEERGNPPHQP